MAWAEDQVPIGVPVEEQVFGDTQISLVTNVPIAAGAWIFVNISCYGVDALATVTDDGPGLTWTIVQGTSTVDSGQRVAIARAFAPAGMASGTTITATWAGASINHKWIGGASFLGGDSGSFDAVVATLADTSTAFTTNPVPTAEDDELIICTGQSGFAYTILVPSPSVEYMDEQSIGTSIYAIYRIVGISGSYTVSGLMLNSAAWVSIAISMRLAGLPPQKLRPDADLDTGDWTPGPLFSKIDEETADGLVITATSA